MKHKLLILGLILCPISLPAHADIALLIHGFQSSGQAWHSSNVVQPLLQSGWQDGGQFGYRAFQILGPNQRQQSSHVFYTVDLPNNAPVLIQVEFLSAVLKSIRQFAPNEAIRLVGHSAGGVIARTAMVLSKDDHIIQLITIASPNLGTGAASAGSALASSPVGTFARMFGENQLSRSGQLLSELSPQKPGSFIAWLNWQPHPDADYVAIVRRKDSVIKGDALIDPGSQDLRNVAALQGRARAVLVDGKHALRRADGDILASLLRQAKPAHVSTQPRYH